MITFSEDCSDDIRQAIVAWSELLAQEKYAEAMAMFEVMYADMTPADLVYSLTDYGDGDIKVTSVWDLCRGFHCD